MSSMDEVLKDMRAGLTKCLTDLQRNVIQNEDLRRRVLEQLLFGNHERTRLATIRKLPHDEVVIRLKDVLARLVPVLEAGDDDWPQLEREVEGIVEEMMAEMGGHDDYMDLFEMYERIEIEMVEEKKLAREDEVR